MQSFFSFLQEQIDRTLFRQIEDATSKLDILNILNVKHIPYREIMVDGNPLIVFDRYVIDDFSYPNIEEKEEYVERHYDEVERDFEEEINRQFWKFPVHLYHATHKNNVKSILQHGLLVQSKSRGLTNRSVGDAIFTVDDHEFLLAGDYGDAIFEINTSSMKKDGFMPVIFKEPSFMEKIQKEYLARQLLLTDYEAPLESDGTWETTYIIRENIPSRYLTLLD